jgi:hypothetical protein
MCFDDTESEDQERVRDMVKEIPRTDSVRSGKCLPSHKSVSRDSVLMVLVNHHEETEESENE